MGAVWTIFIGGSFPFQQQNLPGDFGPLRKRSAQFEFSVTPESAKEFGKDRRKRDRSLMGHSGNFFAHFAEKLEKLMVVFVLPEMVPSRAAACRVLIYSSRTKIRKFRGCARPRMIDLVHLFWQNRKNPYRPNLVWSKVSTLCPTRGRSVSRSRSAGKRRRKDSRR